MNGQEMLRVIDSLQRDRGIDKNIILEGIETATGIDVADKIYEYLESKVRPLSKHKDALRVS